MNALCADVSKIVHRLDTPLDFMFVTGDVAFSGGARSSSGPSEYPNAHKILESLAKAANLQLAQVFVIPGNHDVARTASEAAFEALMQEIEHGANFDERLASSEAISTLKNRFAGFSNFEMSFGPETLEKGHRLFWTHSEDRQTKVPVRIVGLNTALLSCNDEDRGRLRVGMTQLKSFSHQPNTFVVVLAHHPVDWLADQSSIFGWIAARAQLFLVGHLHQHDSIVVSKGGGKTLVQVGAGAVHSDERAPNGLTTNHSYNIGQLFEEKTGSSIRIWPRTWSESQKAFIADRHKCDPESDQAVHLSQWRPPANSAQRHASKARVYKVGAALLLSAIVVVLSLLRWNPNGVRRDAVSQHLDGISQAILYQSNPGDGGFYSMGRRDARPPPGDGSGEWTTSKNLVTLLRWDSKKDQATQESALQWLLHSRGSAEGWGDIGYKDRKTDRFPACNESTTWTTLAAQAALESGDFDKLHTSLVEARTIGIEWILNSQNSDGGWGSFAGEPDQPSRLYPTAMSIVTLTEMLGVVRDTAKTKRALFAGVQFLHDGGLRQPPGWKANQQDRRPCLAASSLALFALLSAKKKGIGTDARPGLDEIVAEWSAAVKNHDLDRNTCHEYVQSPAHNIHDIGRYWEWQAWTLLAAVRSEQEEIIEIAYAGMQPELVNKDRQKPWVLATFGYALVELYSHDTRKGVRAWPPAW